MRIIKVMCSMIASVALFALLAQSDSDYQGWMKQVAASNGKLTKGICRRSCIAAQSVFSVDLAIQTIGAALENQRHGVTRGPCP